MIAEKHTADTMTVDRRAENRRIRKDRRVATAPAPAGADGRIVDRRKVERRRQIDPTTCERDYSDPEIAFMRAMDEYKRKSGRQFPTWSEVLEVIHSMGYRQVEEPTEIYPAGRAS